MVETYTLKVWSKDYMNFADVMLTPVYRTRIQGRKWLYGFWGHYLDPNSKEIHYDTLMLERTGFKKIELVING